MKYLIIMLLTVIGCYQIDKKECRDRSHVYNECVPIKPFRKSFPKLKYDLCNKNTKAINDLLLGTDVTFIDLYSGKEIKSLRKLDVYYKCNYLKK